MTFAKVIELFRTRNRPCFGKRKVASPETTPQANARQGDGNFGSSGVSSVSWEQVQATNACSLFPSTYVKAAGFVQDGGMSGHNNPLKLARLESCRIDPGILAPDIAVSVGTGTYQKSTSPRTSYRHFLLDCFIPRLWRAYMANGFDGDKIYREVVSSVNEEARRSYIRLNTTLPADAPAIDDASRLPELEVCLRLDADLMTACEDAVYALLVVSFYFELCSVPEEL